MTGILGGVIGALRKLFVTWTRRTLSITLWYRTASYAPLTNGKWFAFGSPGSGNSTTVSYSYSNDGVTWTTGSLPVAYVARTSYYTGTHLVVHGTAPNFYYSTNGTTWTASALNSIITDALWDGARAVIGPFSNSVWFSSDGITGATMTNSSALTNGLGLGWNGVIDGVYMLVSNSAAARVCIGNPTVGANWVAITLPTSSTYTTIVYNGSLWIAAAAGKNEYFTSDNNGTSWTSRTLPANFGSGTTDRGRLFVVDKIVYGIFSNAVYYSTDGINWINTSSAADLILAQGWAFGENRLIAIGRTTTTGSLYAYEGSR